MALHEGDESKDQESDQSIPTPKVSGKIRGLDFSADRTFVYDGSLYIQQGNEDGAWDFPDLAVEINLSLKEGVYVRPSDAPGFGWQFDVD